MSAEIGGIWMNVDAIWGRRFGFAPRNPITVHVFPSVSVNLKKRDYYMNLYDENEGLFRI